jgi:alkylation response protein AidB-like acyl-CoA dehydrogenase
VAGALAALGTDDLDPRTDADSLAAAAVLCEVAGRIALPYPVAGSLLRDGDGRPFAVVPDGVARVEHGDLFATWVVATAAGGARTADSAAAPLGSRLGRFVTDLAVEGDAAGVGPHPDLPLHLALTAWGVLGIAGAAVDLAVEHVNGRIQFGKPIATFQAVQFQLADCAVAVAGLRELAAFTLWRLDGDPVAALGDALALRLHAIDVARTVLRATQQLHGAAGVCDEYDISVLARAVQPALRLPWSAERTAAALAATIATDGFVGLFPHGSGHDTGVR